MGRTPGSFGHYEFGHPDCDGDKPCAFRAPCRAFQAFVCKSGGDIDATKAALGKDTISSLAWHLLHDPNVEHAAEEAPRHMAAWRRFFDAFASVLPRDTLIYPKRDLAIPGELFVTVLHKKTSGNMRKLASLPSGWAMSVRGHATPKWDLAIFRFWPRPLTRIEPSVEFRTEVDTLFAAYPSVRRMARRWSRHGLNATARAFARSSVNARAVNVMPEHIEDIARLIGGMMVRGELTDLSWPPSPKVRGDAQSEAAKRRKASRAKAPVDESA